MNKLLRLMLGATLALGFGGLANADFVRFEFNPVDFFDFRDWQEGPSTEGGMFRLHETGGFSGAPTFDSWTIGGHATLVGMRDSLDDDPRPEGIGYIQVFLLKSPNPNDPVTVWGQTLTANPGIAPTGTAPAGWHVLGASESASAWVYQWEADPVAPGSTDSDFLIHPGKDFGDFSLAFTANEAVTMGSNYTFWFGGDNFPGFVPAIDFGVFPGGFEADKPADSVGTAYEVTRSLTAIPEPTTLIHLLGLGLALGLVVWRRRRRR